MKKFLIAVLFGLLSLGVTAHATTITSVNAYLEQQEIDIQNGSLAAPTAMSDAGKELFSGYDGNLIYSSTDLVLPQKGGREFAITRKLNKNTSGNARGLRRYTNKVLASNNGEAYKYIYRYYVGNTSTAVYIAYDTEEEMLVKENGTNQLCVPSNYATNTPNFVLNSSSKVSWYIGYNYIGFDSNVKFYSNMTTTTNGGVILKRDIYNEPVEVIFTDPNKSVSNYVNICDYDQDPTNALAYIKIGNGWDYDIPYVRYKQLDSTTNSGIFYDALAGKTISFSFGRTTSANATVSSSIYYYNASGFKIESNTYTIAVEEINGETHITITRSDGIIFKFRAKSFVGLYDKHGPIITGTSAGNYTDSYGRNIILNENGISVNGSQVVSYVKNMQNDNYVDPNDLLKADNKYTLDVTYGGRTITYETAEIEEKINLGYWWQGGDWQLDFYGTDPGCILKKITLPTGAVTLYSYVCPMISNGSYATLSRATHRLASREERVSETSTTPINKVNYTYSGNSSSMNTTKTWEGQSSYYSVKDLYNSYGNHIESIVESKQSGNQYHITTGYSYNYIDGNWLPVTITTATRATANGSAQTVTEKYEYNNRQQPTNHRRNGVIVETWEYSDAAPYLLIEHFVKRADGVSVGVNEDWIGTVNVLTPNKKDIQTQYVSAKTAENGEKILKTEHKTYEYNEFGDITSISYGDTIPVNESDAYQRITYNYNTLNTSNLAAPALAVTTTTYNISNVTDAIGNGSNTVNLVETMQFDGLGRLTQETNAKGKTTIHQYDAFGRETGTTYPNLSYSTAQYDDIANDVTITSVDGIATKFDFDSLGRRVGDYIQNDSEWEQLYEYVYDNQSRAVQKNIFNDTTSSISYEYYDDNSPKSEVTKEGTAIIGKKEYENAPYASATQGRKTAKIYSSAAVFSTVNQYTNPFGFVEKDEIIFNGETIIQNYVNDKMGNVVSVKDFKANKENLIENTAEYIYNSANRVTQVTTPAGTTQVIYDEYGRVETQIDGMDTATEYTYNEAGWVTQVSRPINSENSDQDSVTKTYYDALGNVTREEVYTSETEFNTTKYVYDEMNNLIAVVTRPNATDEIVTYEYDVAGRMTAMAQGLTALGQPINPATHNVTSYTYDHFGNLESTTDPLGMSEIYSYNSHGQLLTKEDRNGVEASYTYDGHGRAKSIVVGTESTEYTYDWLGNVLEMIDNDGTTTYTYSARGDLLSETRAGYTKSYTYDANGNRKTFAVNGIPQLSTNYTYDAVNRLTQVVGNGDTTNYTYNANNSLLSEITQGVKSAQFTYNTGGLLTDQTNYVSSTQLETYGRTYFDDGNVATANDNGVAKDYTYDGVSRLTSDDGTDFTFDIFSNRATKDSTSYTYDKNNRLLNDGTKSYTYDDNGNMKSAVTSGFWGMSGTLFGYDSFNRLTSVEATSNSGSSLGISYTYDGNGLMQTKIDVDGEETRFIWDGTNIVAEITDDGIITYSRGFRLISRDDGTNKWYYHHNPHGDVTKLTDSTGTVIESYEYDAYGNQLTANGTNPFRYCGEWWDPSTNLIYLRARWYDSKVGAFISEDPIRYDLNWYVYCGNNPVKFFDPWGLAYAPIREVAGALGGTVIWDEKKGGAYVEFNGVRMKNNDGSDMLFNWGGPTGAFIENDTMYVWEEWFLPIACKYLPQYGGLVAPIAGKDAGYRGDSGLDISAPKGTPVVAASSGTVIYSEYGHTTWRTPPDTPYSILIKLDTPITVEDKTVSYLWYTHLSSVRFTVKEDDGQNLRIEQGQIIGTSGLGNRDPHLHFGLIVNRAQANPNDYVTMQGVRDLFESYQGKSISPLGI